MLWVGIAILHFLYKSYFVEYSSLVIVYQGEYFDFLKAMLSCYFICISLKKNKKIIYLYITKNIFILKILIYH